MVCQIKDLVHAVFCIRVDAHISCDLRKSQHVASRRKLEVHNVLIKVNVRGLLAQLLLVIDESGVGAWGELESANCVCCLYHF